MLGSFGAMHAQPYPLAVLSAQKKCPVYVQVGCDRIIKSRCQHPCISHIAVEREIVRIEAAAVVVAQDEAVRSEHVKVPQQRVKGGMPHERGSLLVKQRWNFFCQGLGSRH